MTTQQHVQVGAASGTGALLAVALVGLAHAFGKTVEPDSAAAVGALLAPFVSLLYAWVGAPVPQTTDTANMPPVAGGAPNA